MNFGYDYNELPYGYLPDSSSGSSFDGTFLAVFMSVYLLIIAVIMVIALVKYIFKSVGLYTIAKRMGKEYPWLAWIPFARIYLQGELAECIPLKTRAVRRPGIWLLVIPLALKAVMLALYCAAIAIIGISGNLFGNFVQNVNIGGVAAVLIVIALIYLIIALVDLAVCKTLYALVNFQIIGRFTSRNMAIAHSVLSLFIPLYEAICLFVMRNRTFNPGMEPEENSEAETEQ